MVTAVTQRLTLEPWKPPEVIPVHVLALVSHVSEQVSEGLFLEISYELEISRVHPQ